MDAAVPSSLVGRAGERAAIAAALAALPARAGIVAIEGEPGIGKSRLLAHLAEAAAAAGHRVLGARASEFEADLPYALWTEALDRHLLDMGERRLDRLGLLDPGALAVALPALVDRGGAPAAGDRHRLHRALRDLLERLAGIRPVVLCLDDVHWADTASVDALAALARRLPSAPLLLAVVAREGQLSPVLAAAFAGAMREHRFTQLLLAPLSEAEAGDLVGQAGAALYAQAGGNPFYLEQLARVRGRSDVHASRATDGSVPPAVVAALATELAALSPDARGLLGAAAVAGDPFEPGLAAEIAELPGATALRALDELLAPALVRPAGAPRRFAFRHPVVRHAVYAAAPGGWRLGAHARAAQALERRGSGPVERAHHIEHAAEPGDERAFALLAAAARAMQSPAPAIAARFQAAALRLLPERDERRTRMQALLADAQAASGDPVAARETLLDALRTAGPEERLRLIVAVANTEWWLGRNEDARRRLQVALVDQPARPSTDRIRLRLALTLTALSAGDPHEAAAHASDARDDARALGDPVVEAAALAGAALARATASDGPEAARGLDESVAALERLSGEQLATRLPAFWMHGRARHALGRFDAARADFARGAAIAADTGRESVLLQITVESVATLIELGRLAEAAEAGEEGVERARLSGNPPMLLLAHSALSSARLAAGDVASALQLATEAAEFATPTGFHAAGQPGWCLGAALTAAGNPARALEALLPAFGGSSLGALLPVQRPCAAADLAEAQLACGDLAAAEAVLALGEAAAARSGSGWAAAVTGVARSALLLARGRPEEAVVAAAAAGRSGAGAPPAAQAAGRSGAGAPPAAQAAGRSGAGAPPAAQAAGCSATGAPLLLARARLAEGKSLAAAGRRAAAVAALVAAESAFAGFGARRRRDEAARALRGLGHRVRREAGGDAPGPLTAREREIAELVAAGRTNREVAEQLVLSTRTIEAHLRNVYGKLGVRSRVELVRAIGRAG